MRWIDAPLLGRRPVTEFTINGVLEPEPEQLDGEDAARWVFERTSLPRVRTESWYHAASQLWYLVTRDTGSDAILQVELMRGGD